MDSEHNKNLKSQDWRVSSLMNQVAGPPLSRFHTGSAETLRPKGQEALAAEMKSFFGKHYCPLRSCCLHF